MKKFFALVLIASAFFSFSSSAQKVRGGGATKQVLIDSLKLSPAQADSVISIRQRIAPQIKSIMSDNSLTQEQKKDKVKPIKLDMKKDLERILSHDQLMKLQDLETDMKQNKNKNKDN